jgi:hypothetical protein
MTPQVAQLANGAMIVAALGKAFDGNLPAIAQHETLPPPAPANVVYNAGLTRSIVHGLQRRFPFRLEVPNMIESSSVLTSDSPVRVYNLIKGEKTLRLTFWMENYVDGYWGVQEMAWDDAPALAGEHFSHVLNKRNFDFYYQGKYLHMVVLRQNGASYWVTNTLDNLLSNETMIAIAKGLHPTTGRTSR